MRRVQNCTGFIFCMFHVIVHLKDTLSYDVTSESEITPCIKIDKRLVVYRFSGNVMK